MRKTKPLAIFVVLLLFLTRISAASSCSSLPFSTELTSWYCNEINDQVAAIWSDWEPAVVVAVTLAFLLAGIIFTLGVAFQNEKLRNFGVGELYEAAATTLIIGLFMIITAVLFGVIPLFVTGAINPYNTSLTFIDNVIVATQGAITGMYNIVMLDSFYGSISTVVTVGNHDIGLAGLVQPLAQAVTQYFIIPATVVSSLLVDGLLALTAEFYFILFFMYVSIPIFIIPGIIMRALFPLRQVGGLLMAVGFAFFLIMPILFSVIFYLSTPSTVQDLNAATAALTSNGQGVQSQTNADAPGAPLVTAIQGLQGDVGSYFLAVFFYPALILALTYSSITELARFIGGAAQRTSKFALI